MKIDVDNIRDTMRFWSTGVTIVAAEHEGNRNGLTASSFTSLSLVPPLVLVSIEKKARTYNLVKESGAFGVTILKEDQQEISNRFADPHNDSEYRFANLEVRTMETGSPILEEGLAFFDCRVVATYPAGTQMVFIGEVVAAERGTGEKPLLYFNRAYRSLGE